MGGFIVFSVLLQQLIKLVRRRVPQLDGDYVVAVATLLGVGLAFLLKIAVLGALFGLVVEPLWADYLVSGIAMALGAGWLHDAIKSVGIPAGRYEPPAEG